MCNIRCGVQSLFVCISFRVLFFCFFSRHVGGDFRVKGGRGGRQDVAAAAAGGVLSSF